MEFNIIFLVLAILFWIIKQIGSFNKKTSYPGESIEGEEDRTGRPTFEEILEEFARENRTFSASRTTSRQKEVMTREDYVEQNAFSKFQGTAPKKLDVDLTVDRVQRGNEHYRIKKKKKNKYRKMLQNPETVKKVFVGSLIFERKKY